MSNNSAFSNDKLPQRIFGIGDVHGHFDLFMQAIESLKVRMSGRDLLILLGDYVDRGPDSDKVVAKVRELQQHRNVLALRGNHEELMYLGIYLWYEHGGEETEKSFGGEVPQDVKDWAIGLPSYAVFGKLFFSHANPNRNQPLPHWSADDPRNREDLTWGRDPDTASHPFPYHMVHGHTPKYVKSAEGLARYDVSPRHTNLDTGVDKHRVLTFGEFDPVKGERLSLTSVSIKDGAPYIERFLEPPRLLF